MRHLLLSVSLLLSSNAAAQRVVSCGCWCGAVLQPPCSDSSCIAACGQPTYASTGTSDPPMAGVKVGTWTKHFGSKYGENLNNCGANPMCMVAATGVAVVTLPIGLVVDIPVIVVKGLASGFYYVGKGIAYPFRSRPKPYKPVVEIAAPPPPAKPAADCAGLDAEHDKLTGELKTDAEAFDAAIVKSQLDQGVDAAKGAVKESVEAAEKAGQVLDAKSFKEWLTGFHAGIDSCVAAKSGSDAFLKCLDAVYKTYDESLGKVTEASRVEAAKGALKDYVGGLTKKALPFIERSAACQAR